MEELVFGEYRVYEQLGVGSFGRVMKAISVTTNTHVAIKFEEKVRGKPRLLAQESIVLHALQSGLGIPKFYGSGKHGDMQCMVMELLGPTISSKFKDLNKHFTLKTIIEIADQGIDRIRHMHEHFYMHRDIKPQNFMFGLARTQGVLYIADFGLSKKYQSGPGGMHIPYREDKSFAGTACYASLNTHLGVQQSRRDDIESLLYIICYLLKRRLPWQRKFNTKEDKHNSTRMQKLLITPEDLFRDTPREFAQALVYIRGLGFDDRPDYDMLKSLFAAIAAENRFFIDLNFQWMVSKKEGKEEAGVFKRKEHRKTVPKSHANRDSILDSSHHSRPKRRSVSPSCGNLLRASVGVLPIMPSFESSENSSYQGSDDQEEQDDEDTVKEEKLPTIDRSLIPVKGSSEARVDK